MQGHIDMVCEKNNDVVHDFYQDPLKLVRNGEWLKVGGLLLLIMCPYQRGMYAQL